MKTYKVENWRKEAHPDYVAGYDDAISEVREIVEKTRTVQEDDVDFGWNGAVDLILAKLKELEK